MENEMPSDSPQPSKPSQSIERRPSVSLSRPMTIAPIRRKTEDALVIDPMHAAPQPSSSRWACINGIVLAKPETSVKTPIEPTSTPWWNFAARAASPSAASWTRMALQ